jgi:hypothetical protein
MASITSRLKFAATKNKANQNQNLLGATTIDPSKSKT